MFSSQLLATGVVPFSITTMLKDTSNKILNNKPSLKEGLNKELFHKKCFNYSQSRQIFGE
jgi:hypothetical protein